MTEPLETLEGSVNNITFYSQDTGYCVMQLDPKQLIMGTPGGVVTVVGVMPEIQPGEYVRIEGNWSNHPRYGRQFKVNTMTRVMPISENGIERYLSSGLIKGVGPSTAQRIVEHFGTEALNILDSPEVIERLLEVEGIGQHRAEIIAKGWREQREIADVMMFLQQYQITAGLAYKIYKFYKDEDMSAAQILRENPYQLSRDIHGVGFKKADRIAQNIGLPKDSPQRMEAALIYVLEETVSEGHVYYPRGQLIDAALELLEIEDAEEAVGAALDRLIQDNMVRSDMVSSPFGASDMINGIYQPTLYYSEIGTVDHVRKMQEQRDSVLLRKIEQMSPGALSQLIDHITQEKGFSLTNQQKEAVQTALSNKISILTGGPGTGKTTTLLSLIGTLEALHCTYKLASPTGRAAKRLSQATGRDAQTIHRMLGFRYSEGFVHNAENTLTAHFVVIDESSMLDIHLFYALMRAISPDSHLLLVGDVDQLPSVGAGDVLRDIIRSLVCPITRLNTIFRQERGSQIIQNAHLVNRGEIPNLDNEGDDFFFFGKEDPLEAADLLVDVVQNRIPNKFGFDPIEDIQVLSPMYRTPVGVHALNEALQAKLNPPGRKAEHRLAGQLFRVGDKVMQMKNNYDKLVFNGDIGRVHSINPVEQIMNVVIDDELYDYDWTEADQLTLAYACSVHRSQGSEYPVVVIPILTQHYMMLQRNLLYTAITRARKLVVLIGTRKAVGIAVRNNKVARRWTALDWRLQQAIFNR